MQARTESAHGWGLMFFLVGPSGVGKNTLMKWLMARVSDIKQMPTATTRPPREGEQPGREHYFVTLEEFQEMKRRGELLEQQEVHQDQWYGVPRFAVEDPIMRDEDRVADIDILGATAIRSLYPENTILIFIQPPTIDDLRKRLAERNETPEEIERRISRAGMELERRAECDYLITNDDLDRAGAILMGIVAAERSRREIRRLRDVHLEMQSV